MNLLRYLTFLACVFASLFNPNFIFAEETIYLEPIVVTGTHFEKAQNQMGSDVTIITQEDIQNSQSNNLADVLRKIPGIQIHQTGTGLASLFMRGGYSDSTLVLLDGVPIIDQYALSFDFSRISLSNIEKIEVVKGAQSALYGAGALSGVINIITKKGSSTPQASIYAQAGVPTNALLDLQASAGSEKLSWALGLTSSYRDQISSHTVNTENDAVSNTAFSGSITYKASELFDIRAIARLSYDDISYDDVYAPDVDAHSISHLTFIDISPSLYLLNGLWKQTLNLSFTNNHFNFNDSYPRELTSSAYRADWQHQIDLDKHQFAFGALYEYNELSKDKEDPTSKAHDISNYALYAEYNMMPYDNLSLTFAGRYDNYIDKEDALTGTASISYLYEKTNTLLRASIGNAFKYPILYKLYDPFSGNEDLKPEEALSWDFGIEQPMLEDRLIVSFNYFNAEYKERVDWDYATYKYQNLGKVHVKGFELGLDFYPTDNLIIGASVSYNESKVHATQEPQPYQPQAQFLLDIDYTLPFDTSAVYTIGMSLLHAANRYDAYNELDDYTLVDLRFKAQITEDFAITAKVNNLFDYKYEVYPKYNTLGINGNIGVEYKF